MKVEDSKPLISIVTVCFNSENTIKDTIDWLDKKKTNLEEQLTKVNTDLAQSRQKLNQLIGIIKQIEMEKSKNISVK